ncbi:hypothetical protein JTE90_004715 [Oedothorax gibbosus]|uniref:Uncharacterized protein n=1 Tax=Oedothorax gibbosus TaxID=931172 RepID=A0AAV6U209_9ARAC|nr:hypothetical protein JTE90_004715 [Oedothorax gibbosus]
MYLLIILCAVLFARAAEAVVVEDVELSNFLDDGPSNLTLAAGRAARWLFDQRDPEKGWGPFTPRAAVALALARRAIAMPEAEWDIVSKQLSVQLAVELGRTSHRQLSSSRLAHFVNALLATCLDPRRFNGMDLVRRLRTQVDAEVRSGDLFPLPLATLCLSGEATYNDMTSLFEAHQESPNKLDLQSLQLLALSCITRQQQFSDSRNIFSQQLKNFASKFHHSLRRNTADVYTKALAMQALNSGDSVDVSGLSSFLSDQGSDGSFEDSLLATYHAIPALMGSSLLALADIQCDAASAASQQTALPDSRSPPKLVQVSLWVGEDGEKDTHTVTVAAGHNDTLLDVMRKASDRNHLFRFQSDTTLQGVRVYSIAGVPNDSEREVKWKLHIQKHGPNEHLHEIKNRGIDRVFPSHDDRIVFWFQRDAML